jgi:hypothetical protein
LLRNLHFNYRTSKKRLSGQIMPGNGYNQVLRSRQDKEPQTHFSNNLNVALLLAYVPGRKDQGLY